MPSRGRDASMPEVAHVLFMDVVSFALLTMDQQQEVRLQLQDIVRLLPEYDRAQKASDVISISTGDGMVLAFFRDLTAPVSCARTIALTIKNNPLFKLRMGIHSGPVLRVADINANLDITGGGIIYAQRVMNAGDGGHILVSKTTADMLVQLAAWKDALHDLGEIEVKHRERIHIFNVFTEDFGNSRPPSRVRSTSQWSSPKRLAASIVALAVACAGVFLLYLKFAGSPRGMPASQTASNPPANTAPPSKPAPPAATVAPSNPITTAMPEPTPAAPEPSPEPSPASDSKITNTTEITVAVADGPEAASHSDLSHPAPPVEQASPLARGLAFYNAKNYASALPLLRQAADSGDSRAMTIVGWMYQRGWAVSQDYVEAMQWFRKGAGANPPNPASMAEIGQLYMTGAGVQQDYAESMAWFRRAADAGSAFGMWKVGILYQNGWGVNKDYNEASNWFTKASDAGEVRAMGSLGLLYQEGRGVHQDFGQALLWFQKGAAAGNRDDMRRIGVLCEHGKGIRKNYDEAMKWYRQASDAGDYIAMSFIGNLYEHGSGVKKDKDQAISWYRKAVAAGNKQANGDLRRLHAQP